jgi:DNA-directed RNA polymerase specialized sigma24 family protein
VRRTEAERHPRRTSAANGHGANDVDAAATAPGLEALWDRHGASLYALACALLGDEAAAVRTVTLAMVDLARTPASDWPIDIPRYLSERVYRRSQTLTTEPSGASHVPASMRWLARLARLQRTCLALCVFGGYTHREVAELLDAAPATVAELLTTGLRELGHLAGGGPAIA